MTQLNWKGTLGRLWALILLLTAGIVTGARAAGPQVDLTPGAEAPKKTYVVVMPGTHPGILFSEQELPAMRKRAAGGSVGAEAYKKVKEMAIEPYNPQMTAKQAVGRQGTRLARQLQCMALVYQVERDERMGHKAVKLFKTIATGIDPQEFYDVVDSDFFATEHWPIAFAVAWDWLFPLMSPEERSVVLKSLEQWAMALDAHTEKWWWRDAGYNCGAIPVGALGFLLTSIQGETHHPQAELIRTKCFRKIRDNYFRLTWRASGVCNEGPGYAHYHRNPTLFAEAVRRTGGPDIIPTTGAVNAMHYLRHQWMPHGGCGPVGDNTEYGRRVFQSIYLHGIRELGDRAGLWTFLTHTDFARINPLEIFLFYPDDLKPISPGTLDLPTSFYFEIDNNRAGNVFARSEWDNPQASWFGFVTRYTSANHTHYDMNTFLFTAFGEEFATHANVYPYSHRDHGVDFEHNIVIIDQGGMPANDRPNSAGDDGSINGLMTGVGLGHFADYVRGDARLSYADRSIRNSKPALRADRTVLFAKQGPNPYIFVADDIQKDTDEHDYHWQWYTQARSISGEGRPERPFVIDGKEAHCGISFIDLQKLQYEFKVVKSPNERRALELGLLRVNLRGVRVRYLAVGLAWRNGAKQPLVRPGPKIRGNPHAASVLVEGEDFHDLIVWQPEEVPDARGVALACGKLKTDALLAVLRTDRTGNIVGYVMGDGTRMGYGSRILARSERALSVSADAKRTMATGPRRARQGLDPLPVAGSFWLPGSTSEVWADGVRLKMLKSSGKMVSVSLK